jgi:crotonobetainyl-CoA:carnitine CoA-transferase CaiB-like acyl-CoA transferase
MTAGQPLDGVRILSLEQMQAMPFATQLLGRLGADVVKIEHPAHGDLGRGSLPAMTDPTGRRVGATFLRNNLGKRSVAIDLRSDAGRELVLRLAPRFDVVCENFKAGALGRLGLGYDDVAAVHPSVVYVSISGFGNRQVDGGGESPYASWPAYAAVAEAMSGLYEWNRREGEPPRPLPAGALGDIGTGMFAAVGLLAALRQREHTGVGQHVDVAMFDAMIAFSDVVTNFWSMGDRTTGGRGPEIILDGFEAADGWFVVQVGREYEFERLAKLVGRPEWLDDDRLSTRAGWRANIDVIREGVNAWTADKSSVQACHELAAASIAAGPVLTAQQVLDDPHVAQRNMIVEIERTDDGPGPIAVPGNPVKLSAVPELRQTRPPWLGEHTASVLREELGVDDAELAELRQAGVII